MGGWKETKGGREGISPEHQFLVPPLSLMSYILKAHSGRYADALISYTPVRDLHYFYRPTVGPCHVHRIPTSTTDGVAWSVSLCVHVCAGHTREPCKNG